MTMRRVHLGVMCLFSRSVDLGEGTQGSANLQWHNGLCSKGVAG